jgi:hypothetical protein
MNAAKRIKKMMDEGDKNGQLALLKSLAIALELKLPFELASLHSLDASHFRLALLLVEDWHHGHHIDARGRLMERLLAENPALLRPSPAPAPAAVAPRTARRRTAAVAPSA